ncbi:hypothetical protein NGB36_10240 [Streptomyces sp. RB6PN25]|uniref:Integral membrane protein n=1 Tax=Streptomyces humicola TaxID=2953240 RepID=A0ABT1PTI8_9ACTN|nr:hypothetical protein [Streptomyces humicola]MCQ4080966.1 hypothetical protein [Streptomyces humicola]
MSDESTPAPESEPQPEPIRFFGTTWVHHDGGYALRRAAVGVGALAAAAAGAFVLRFAYEGFDTANVGIAVKVLFVVALAICTALAFRRTWEGFVRRPGPDSPAETSRGLMLIGFIGSLLAYSLRCLTEAPGEQLRRAEYEHALSSYKQGKRRTRG